MLSRQDLELAQASVPGVIAIGSAGYWLRKILEEYTDNHQGPWMIVTNAGIELTKKKLKNLEDELRVAKSHAAELEAQMKTEQELARQYEIGCDMWKKENDKLSSVGRKLLEIENSSEDHDTVQYGEKWIDVLEELAALVHDEKNGPKYVPAKDGDGVEVVRVSEGRISEAEWRWLFINGRRYRIEGTRVTIREILKLAGADITKNYVQYAAGEGLADCRTDDNFLLVDDTANFQVKARA